jgi:hypothetical protein
MYFSPSPKPAGKRLPESVTSSSSAMGGGYGTKFTLNEMVVHSLKNPLILVPL